MPSLPPGWRLGGYGLGPVPGRAAADGGRRGRSARRRRSAAAGVSTPSDGPGRRRRALVQVSFPARAHAVPLSASPRPNLPPSVPLASLTEGSPTRDAQAGRRPADPDTGSGEIEPVEVHDLDPRGHEVTHELLLRVAARVDLRDAPELGVRAEDEIDGGGGPGDLTGGPVPYLEHVLSRGGWLPLLAHVAQVHEEVVGQRLRPVNTRAGTARSWLSAPAGRRSARS